eukprot:5516600-Karenia_brevis.AAC.1
MLTSGNAILDLRARPHERIDQLLLGFEIAREESRAVGAEMTNSHHLTTILLRQISPNSTRLVQLTQPLGNRLPRNQTEFHALLARIRSMGHLLQKSLGSIVS